MDRQRPRLSMAEYGRFRSRNPWLNLLLIGTLGVGNLLLGACGSGNSGRLATETPVPTTTLVPALATRESVDRTQDAATVATAVVQGTPERFKEELLTVPKWLVKGAVGLRFYDRERIKNAFGASGFVIYSDGNMMIILTAGHAIDSLPTATVPIMVIDRVSAPLGEPNSFSSNDYEVLRWRGAADIGLLGLRIPASASDEERAQMRLPVIDEPVPLLDSAYNFVPGEQFSTLCWPGIVRTKQLGPAVVSSFTTLPDAQDPRLPLTEFGHGMIGFQASETHGSSGVLLGTPDGRGVAVVTEIRDSTSMYAAPITQEVVDKVAQAVQGNWP